MRSLIVTIVLAVCVSLIFTIVLVVSVSCALVFTGFYSRTVIQSLPIPGHPSSKVVISRLQSDGETWYRVEFPDGAYTKRWLNGTETTPEEIRKNCRVEYDGQTLRVLGPRRSDVLEVPGLCVD